MDDDAITAIAARFSIEQRAELLNLVHGGDQLATIRDRYTSPADLMAACDPSYVVTPAIELIGREIERTLDTPGHHLLITAPPQEGKSMLTCVGTPIRALQKNPSRRCILAMYGDTLASEHGGRCRDMLARYGTGATDPMTGKPMEDRIGLGLDPSYNAAGRWRVKHHDGGLVSAGIGSGITGRPADLFIVDDPYKVAGEADSGTYRRKIEAFFNSVVYLRLGPGANIILILTRWHDQDIAGHIMRAEAELPERLRRWTHINIPAIAADGVPDALGRQPGQYLQSARGRTAEEFDATRRNIGERTFWAMYQGVPRPPAGGLIQQEWIDNAALDLTPHTTGGVVAVDPADTGDGDEAGVIAAAKLGPDVVITHDWSGHMTSDQWARKAVLLAAHTNARAIHVEAYAAGVTYAAVVRTAIKRIAEEAKHGDGFVDGVDCTSLMRGVHPRVQPWRAKGDAVQRSVGLRTGLERGTIRLGPDVEQFADDAVGWQEGQHCPDRVAAAIIAVDVLTTRGGVTSLAAPAGTAQRPAPGSRGGAWGRSIG